MCDEATVHAAHVCYEATEIEDVKGTEREKLYLVIHPQNARCPGRLHPVTQPLNAKYTGLSTSRVVL